MDTGNLEQTVADVLAAVPGGVSLLASLPVRGRARLVDRLPARALPPAGVAERYGAVFDLDPSEQIARQLWFRAFEPRDLRAALDVVPAGGTALDVGANIGAYALPLAAKVGSSGRVDAFEPAPDVHARLTRSADLNGFDQLTCWPAAVSDRPGTAELHIPPGWNRGGAALAAYGRDGEATVDVPVVTIDEHLAVHDVGTVDLLKVDIEGHEPELFDGAAHALEHGRIRRVLVEFNGYYVDRRGHTVESFFAPLRDAGYRPERLRLRLLRRLLAGDVDPTTVCENFLLRR